MDTGPVYNSALWRQTRELALERDGHRCTVARLLGGTCSGALHAHHIHKIIDGGDPFDVENVGTSCAHHHPMWEALRRQLVEAILAGPPTCRHDHRSADARRQCEARMARRARSRLLAAA